MRISDIKPEITGSAGSVCARNAAQPAQAKGVDFSGIMQKKVGELKFSAHAQTRLKSRNINLTNDMMSRLDRAVSGAKEKGARDTLVLLSNLAFIVNIPNKTVVTAMEGNSIKENIFTILNK